tara:strand:- start:4632 stop:4913 length:282 start_codon:yes stop_codon:yes gene_type:complete
MIYDIIDWIRRDYKVNRFRFIVEFTAWLMSIGCTILMAATVPNPPFLLLYPLFIVQCSMLAWAAHSRNSTGMFANYMLIVIIDIVALIRLLTI